MGFMARALWPESYHHPFLELSAISGAGRGKKPQGGLLSSMTASFLWDLHALGKETVRHQEISLTC